MKWKVKAIAVMVFVALMGSAVHFIYSVYAENGQLTKDNQSLNSQLSEKAALIINQQERIKHLAEIDTTRLQELTNAKSK
ncbi:lysis protein, partial [Xenorhabdus sp. CUL]|nr:lysis protein [Xenorhabdus sp. CUL]